MAGRLPRRSYHHSLRRLSLDERQGDTTRGSSGFSSAGSATCSDILVIAIDFGTTYSGYAYSFKDGFLRDPLQVQCLNVKVGEPGSEKMARRVPTCILFSPDRKFVAFGQEAEDKWADMLDEDRREANKWYYFERFKMELHRQESLSRTLTLMDKTKKKSMSGLVVFSAAIKYLKKHALKELRKQGSLVNEDEIKWVLTVPAIWNDGSRQFMREAATKAGIENDRLVLALEPEAASVYCFHYFRSSQSSSEQSFAARDKRFMTVDCGGGTVDISVFRVGKRGNLEQLHRPEGAACGGTKVDDSFKALLHEIIGFDGVAAIDAKDMLDFMRNLEMSKSQSVFSDKFPISIPHQLRENLSVSLRGSRFLPEVTMVKCKLMIEKSTAESFYDESRQGIIEAMERVFHSDRVGRLDAIFLVGGLSESRIIQDAVREAFPELPVLVPPSPSLTVVMGAVQYGHSPQVISTRVAAYTYGVDEMRSFVEGEHDEAKCEIIEGEKFCADIFSIFVCINDVVSIDQRLPCQTFNPVYTEQEAVDFSIFRTRSPSPRYVTDEGCEMIGHFTVDMPDLTGDKDREIQATMSVSGTELKVMARDENTQKEFSTSCDFLSH